MIGVLAGVGLVGLAGVLFVRSVSLTHVQCIIEGSASHQCWFCHLLAGWGGPIVGLAGFLFVRSVSLSHES